MKHADRFALKPGPVYDGGSVCIAFVPDDGF